MLPILSPLTELRQKLKTGHLEPVQIARETTTRANSSASRNTFLHFDVADLALQAAALEIRFPDNTKRPPLYAIPASIKDCFDVAGTTTTAGTRFYAAHNAPAPTHSVVAQRLLDLGCLLTGKTHLHPLAYGITGQNPDYGDCLQPWHSNLLTGGSSSGAASSVLEGSSLFAIGTDTGGSIRVPAALCGLAGFRASHNLTRHWPELWQGGMHLAPSFDTFGFLTRDSRDLEPIALALLDLPAVASPVSPRIGIVPRSFLHDADPEVFASFVTLENVFTNIGVRLSTIKTDWWADSFDILAPIQAHEAAQIHADHFDHFPADIAQRLHWGANIASGELAALRQRHDTFRSRLNALFNDFDFLVLPASPRHQLLANADHTATRGQILRYTTPFSLGGNPIVTVSGEEFGESRGTGFQIAAAPGRDAELLAYTTFLANHLSLRR